MRLETEFRLCLERQTLEQSWRNACGWTARQLAVPLTQSAIAPSTWVKLWRSPSPYSSDEALLLCQMADNQWLAWIPDYGEMVLEPGQFERLSE